MLDFNKYEWISFDCYGTLVDWETGISEAVAAVFARHGVRKSRAEILALFADAEPKVQSSGEFLDSRRVLTDVMQLMAWECSIRLTTAEAQLLPDSLPSWPVFPDAPDALRAAPVSLQAGNHLQCGRRPVQDVRRKRLGIKFNPIITSRQAGGLQAGPEAFFTWLRNVLGLDDCP